MSLNKGNNIRDNRDRGAGLLCGSSDADKQLNPQQTNLCVSSTGRTGTTKETEWSGEQSAQYIEELTSASEPLSLSLHTGWDSCAQPSRASPTCEGTQSVTCATWTWHMAAHSHALVCSCHSIMQTNLFQCCSGGLEGQLYNAVWEQKVQLPIPWCCQGQSKPQEKKPFIVWREGQGKRILIYSLLLVFLFSCVYNLYDSCKVVVVV